MTRPTRTLLLPLLCLGATALPAVAQAQQVGPANSAVPQSEVSEAFRAAPMPRARNVSGPDSWPASIKAIFVGAEGGVGFASVKHPKLAESKMMGPMLAFQLGYRVSPRWTLSVVYTDFQQTISRTGVDGLYAPIHTAADCTHCSTPTPTSGIVTQGTFRLATLGPSVDVTPFGRDGLFIGASGGVAMVTVIDTTYGFGGTARAGFRFRPVENLALSLEGGAQGQTFSGGSAYLGYGAAEVRLSF